MPHRSRYVTVLGAVIVAIAIGHSGLKVATGGALLEAVLEFVLLSFSGMLILSIGLWLTRSDIDPDFYSRIALWCLGGVGVMVVFLLVRSLHPGVVNPFSHETRAIGLALGSLAGLGIGIHDARALTRERDVARRNDELKRTQERLERHNEELTRTREELERSVLQVEASNERLEQFAYVVSHDLQEPLRMVSSYLQLVERRYGDELDEDGEEFLAFAIDGADRMRAIIEGLLAYARVETQGDPFEPIDLGEVLADSRKNLDLQIRETNAVITAGELPRVEGDASQLRQLFQNLLSNAMAYSGDGPPRIHVAAERDRDEWLVSVRDEGIGIGSDEQDRIFEVFQRLHSHEEHPGTGIGLALCHRIVERHGGEIRVDSEPGEGATFSFSLPAVDEDRGPSVPDS